MTDERRGRVQTVLGLIDPSELGPTMMHEHIGRSISDEPTYPTEPKDDLGKRMALEPVSQASLWWVRYNMRESVDNNVRADHEIWLSEVELYKQSGGGTLVEVTPNGARGLDRLAEISRATDVNIVAGAGHYIGHTHRPEARIAESSIDQLAARLVDDILVGDPATGGKAGYLGEIGCSWPLWDTERKVLEAVAVTQQETGVSISIHPGRNDASVLEIRDILGAAGADLSRVVMGHIDRCGYELETRLDLLDSGVVLEYDVFGMEGYYPWEAAVAEHTMPEMPNDTGRIREIKDLIERGFGDQVVVSHDIHMKYQMAHYGGWGYGHILRNVVPLMRVWGLTDAQIRALIEGTPARLLTIV